MMQGWTIRIIFGTWKHCFRRGGLALSGCVSLVTAYSGLLSLGYVSSAHAESLSDIAARDMQELAAQLPGIYTNAERVYFDGLTDDIADTAKAKDITLTVTPSGQDVGVADFQENPGLDRIFDLHWDGADVPAAAYHRVSLHAAPQTGQLETRFWSAVAGDSAPACVSDLTYSAGGVHLDEECGIASISDTAIGLVGDTRRDMALMKARMFSCWLSVPKASGTGFTWHPGLKIHDQGDMVWVDNPEAKTPHIGLKIRRVDWPYGRNRNSLVLYVHTDDPARADSYVWTGYDGDRLALNLRWMQASCTLVPA